MTASKTVFSDRRHLDNNPKIVSEGDIIDILKQFKI